MKKGKTLAGGSVYLYCGVWFTSNMPEAEILAMEFGENCTVEKYPAGGANAYHTSFEIEAPAVAKCGPCWHTVAAKVADAVLIEKLCSAWVGGSYPAS